MSEQLSLFADAPSRTRLDSPREVRPADFPGQLTETARNLPEGLFIGTSSWSFPGWHGLVYAENYEPAELAHGGLAAYARFPLFRSVGIDRTFYAPIPREEYERYAAQVPTGFRFVVKAPVQCVSPKLRADPGNRALDNPHFLDPAWAVRHFIEPAMQGLGRNTGPLIFQFSPLPRALAREPAEFAWRVGTFLRALPKGPVYAVELRDEALLTDEYLHVVADAGARHCVGLHPRQPSAAEQARLLRKLSPGPLVVRWNLHRDYAHEEARVRYFPFSQLRDEDLPTRVTLARLCLEAAAAHQPAFVIVNNKAEGSAPLTILKLAELVAAEAARHHGRLWVGDHDV